jgi:hypothetical protein
LAPTGQGVKYGQYPIVGHTLYRLGVHRILFLVSVEQIEWPDFAAGTAVDSVCHLERWRALKLAQPLDAIPRYADDLSESSVLVRRR